MNILLVGAPGSGKGTMSALLEKDYHLVHIATGDMLRESIKKNTPVGQKAQEYIIKGELVPDQIIHDMIVERLSQDDVKEGFLMDGYPRNLAQAQDFDIILKQVGLHIDLVIMMDIDEKILAERITGRRLCKKCGAIYHIKTKPSKVEGVCDLCGGELYTRKDDTLESLTVRMKEYHQATMPILDYYADQGLLKRIDAALPMKDVYDELKTLLGSTDDHD